jgi:hypothetical protein
MTMSVTSPPFSRFIICTLGTQVFVALWPVVRSKSGSSSRYASRNAADAMTLIAAM